MSQSIPVDIVESWITKIQSILKGAAQESKTQPDFWINKGMSHGIAQIESKLTTWLRHKENKNRLSSFGKKFLITKDVNLSDGRYRKLEWYQGDEFIVLAWRHGMREERGELMLEVQATKDLSKTFLVYQGNSSFDDLAALARERRDGGYTERGEPARLRGEGMDMSVSERFFVDYYPLIRYKSGERGFFLVTLHLHELTRPKPPGLAVLPNHNKSKLFPIHTQM